MEYAESAMPAMVICWVGNNDVLSAVTAFGKMDASQLTPVADFERDYQALVDRLDALVTSHGTKVVLANIPDVTDIGFLIDRATAEAMTGFPVDLPEGSSTSIIGVILMKLFGNDSLVSDPNFVLDASEVAMIWDRIEDFNTIIQQPADRIGMTVVDVNGKFKEFVAEQPVYFGIPLSRQILQGLFSLDGIHPSHIGHALLANEFIRTMNEAFGMAVPEIGENVLAVLFLFDPSLDKDGDGKATGRLGVGFVETLAYLFGITGDPNDLVPD